MAKPGWRIAALLLLSPLAAAAHEKWVVSADDVKRLRTAPPPPEFAHFFPWIAGCAALVVLAVLVLAYVDRACRRKRLGAGLCRSLLRLRGAAPPLVGIGTGAVLLWSGWTRAFLAPDLALDAVLPHAGATAFAWAEIAIGAALCLGACTRAAAVALLVLYLPGALLFGLRSWLDYVDVAGFGVYLALAGRGGFSVDALRGLPAPPEATGRIAVALLRQFVGLNLALLAINNKLVNPAISMKIVADWHLNFMTRLGFAWFTDARFVLAAATVEILVGLLLVVGVLLRPVAIVVFGLLVTTFMIFGVHELVGHLPIVASGLAVLLMGTGGRLWYGEFLDGEAPAPDAATRL